MRHNLLFITTYTGLGGGETSLLTQVEHLDRARYLPHLLVPGEGQLAERWRALGGVVHIRRWRGASTWFIPAIWAQFPIVRHIEHLVRREAIALIHSDYHSLPFALPAARRAGIPCIWTCWGWWFRPKPWQRRFFRQPDATIAASWAIREGFLGAPPFMPPERIEIIPPGVDTARFSPSVDGRGVREEVGIAQEVPLVALIARFQDVKGHDVFLAMAKIVAAQIPDARFIVAGENTHTNADNAYKRRILEHARTDPTLSKTLTYLGFRPDAERVIAAADVVVCSSDFESYGMVNVEAMASGKPVVSTRRGGPSETVVDGETGFLVDPRDSAALAEQVIRLLRDPALRARMGAAGRARVEANFAAEVTAARFGAQIDRLLERER
jgi:glycosyltransferase involved in cell wall biosynthesis